MKIGTLTTGASVDTTFTLQWCPQFIFFVAATQLTRLKVTALGDGVICDLDANGLSSIGRAFRINDITNGYVIPLSDGLLTKKNLDLVFTNSAAQTPDVFAFSMNEGSAYVQSFAKTITAKSGEYLSDFSLAAFPNSAADDDEWNITYQDGTNQKLDQVELRAMLSFDNLIANATSDFVVRNDERTIRSINFLPNAEQVIYIQRFAPVVKGIGTNY